jgi:hypothetical protein
VPYLAVKTGMVAKEGNTDEWANMVFIETHMGVENYVYLAWVFFSILLLLYISKFKYPIQHLCQESVNICAPPRTIRYPWTVYTNHPIPAGVTFKLVTESTFFTRVDSAYLQCFLLHSLFFVAPGLSLSALEFIFWHKCAGIGHKHKAITLSRCWHSSQNTGHHICVGDLDLEIIALVRSHTLLTGGQFTSL